MNIINIKLILSILIDKEYNNIYKMDYIQYSDLIKSYIKLSKYEKNIFINNYIRYKIIITHLLSKYLWNNMSDNIPKILDYSINYKLEKSKILKKIYINFLKKSKIFYLNEMTKSILNRQNPINYKIVLSKICKYLKIDMNKYKSTDIFKYNNNTYGKLKYLYDITDKCINKLHITKIFIN